MTGVDERAKLRGFGLTVGPVLAGLFGLLLPWLFGHAWPLWPWIAGAVLAFWALAWPAGLRPLHRGWMQFGRLAAFINTRVLLGLIFYLMVLPTGLILRVLGKDPMARRLERGLTSYRVTSRQPPDDHLKRPF